LKDALSGSDIVILLLPDTAPTANILNAQTLSYLNKGAYVINPGRGPLIDDQALISALDSGQLAHATLDVFRTEPLPTTDPYWAHPKVTVVPHRASETRASTAAEVIAENIRRNEAGEPRSHGGILNTLRSTDHSAAIFAASTRTALYLNSGILP
jgi:glyoxylate/hydroxypyruvate reductase A